MSVTPAYAAALLPISLRIERVNLNQVLAEQCEELHLQAHERGLDLKLAAVDDGLFVGADLGRLEQVIRNLLMNAIKFTDRGGVSVVATVTEGAARIETEDTGIGIATDQQDRLFNIFQRIASLSGEMRPGTGLGLVISRRLVEAMDGIMGVDSELGSGSTFWFTVPRASSAACRQAA